MLRGHETLIRLVGKRRRLDHDLVFSCVDETPNESAVEGGMHLTSNMLGPVGGLLQQNGTNEAAPLPVTKLGVTMACKDSSLSPSMRDIGKEKSFFNWVKCPVCGKDVHGDDHSINIHLDLCLLEKPKCKFNQLTLSQFGSGTACSSGQMRVERKRAVLKNAKKPLFNQSKLAEIKVAQCSLSVLSEFTSELCERGESAGLLKEAGFIETRGGYQSTESVVAGSISSVMQDIAQSQKEEANAFMYHECNCPCHLKRDVLELGHGREANSSDPCNSHCQEELASDCCQETCTSAELADTQREHQDWEVFTLETVIVGRRFNRHAKVEKDMELTALREPDNPKDQNAIKIVGPDSQGGLKIGHLPRDLASHLSCLLDKDLLKIKVIILKVPEKALEPVPIKLLCEKRTLRDKEDVDCFQGIFQKIHQVGKHDNGRQESVNQHQRGYLHNFTYLVKAVLERESHLFNEEELAFLGSFFSLTENAQCLFVRLSQRKGPWFRVSQINYGEISNAEQASTELLASGFLSTGDSLEEEGCFEQAIRERMHVLNVPELKQLLSMINWKSKTIDSGASKRDDLLDWIVSAAKEKYQNLSSESCSEEAAIVPLILKMIGLCVRVSDTASFLLWRLQRLFFLNGEQDVSAFLLVDMGTFKYPSYTCSQTSKIFVTREALLAYEQALEVAQAMDMAVESNDQQSIEHCLSRACLQLSSNEAHIVGVEDCGPGDVFLARFTAAWVYTTIVTLGVSALERERRYTEAVELLKQLLGQSHCPGKRGYWTVRLSMDLEHLGHKEESLEAAEAGLYDPRIRNGDRVALQRRVLRLGKPPRRWKKPSFADALARACKEVIITGRPLNCKTGVKSRFYGYNDQQCTVEELALQYYAGDSGGGWQGVHSESGVWMTLFALLMWDVLFADIPNVFWHPFQTAPLDLNTDAFYPGRKAIIEAQLRRIQHGEAPELLAATWSKWFGTFCKGLNWERHSLEELQVMASCVGGSGLASICRLLAEDHAGWAGGMPDLLLWRVPMSTPRSCTICCDHGTNVFLEGAYRSRVGEAKLVEVKSPRDRLSEQQRAWINILMEAGIHVEVCKVLEQPKFRE